MYTYPPTHVRTCNLVTSCPFLSRESDVAIQTVNMMYMCRCAQLHCTSRRDTCTCTCTCTCTLRWMRPLPAHNKGGAWGGDIHYNIPAVTHHVNPSVQTVMDLVVSDDGVTSCSYLNSSKCVTCGWARQRYVLSIWQANVHLLMYKTGFSLTRKYM